MRTVSTASTTDPQSFTRWKATGPAVDLTLSTTMRTPPTDPAPFGHRATDAGGGGRPTSGDHPARRTQRGVLVAVVEIPWADLFAARDRQVGAEEGLAAGRSAFTFHRLPARRLCPEGPEISW